MNGERREGAAGRGLPGRANAVLGSLLVATGGMAGAFAVTLGVILVVRVFDVALTPVASFALTLLSGAIGFVAVALLYHRYRGVDTVPYVGIGLPSLRDVGVVVFGYVGTMSLLIASAIVVTSLGIETDTANRAAQQGFERPVLLLWLVPLSFFVIAPGEELLFRGTVQNRLREAFSPWIAIPATAALFAVLHFFSLTGGAGGRFVAIAILFFPSLVFGAVYEYTGNIATPILVHGAYNSTLALLGYVALQEFPSQELALLL